MEPATMSQTQARIAPMDPPRAGDAKVRADLAATAQYLSFEPGLYAVDFSAARSSATDVGLHLPCLRLEPIPPSGRQSGRAFVSATSEGGWIWRGTEPTFVLVVGGSAGVVLTIYKASDGMPAPQVRIRYVGAEGAAPGGGVPAFGPSSPAVGLPVGSGQSPQAGEQPGSVPMSQLAHVRGIGDLKTIGADWTGRPNGNAPIEGFAIMPIGMIGEDSLEYQGVLGNNWNTPWFSAGEFCGSRGLALELLGFRLRLKDSAAAEFECNYWGSFVGKGIIGPIADGEVCEAEGAPLEALRIVITPRAAAPLATAASADKVVKPVRKKKGE